MMGMNKLEGHYARITVCDLAHNKVYISAPWPVAVIQTEVRSML